MNSPKPIRDEEIDSLLARRYRDTTPAFESRWIALKRDLRSGPVRRSRAWTGWPAWTVMGAAAAVLLISTFTWRRASQPAFDISPALAELFTMDAALMPAKALLNEENREALLHLPVQPPPRS